MSGTDKVIKHVFLKTINNSMYFEALYHVLIPIIEINRS
jgi:hypothetical protein